MRYLKTGSIILFMIFVAGVSCDIHEPVMPTEQFQPAGLDGLEVNSFLVDGGTLYAATEDGVWSSALGQDRPDWNEEGLAGMDVVDLTVLVGGELLAGIRIDQMTSDVPTLYRHDVFTDEWEPFQQNYGGQDNFNWVERLAAHPNRPDHVFARGAWHTARSTDSGESWELVFGEWDDVGFQADLLEFDPHNTDRVWIGGESAAFQPYLYFSNHLGQSWQEVELVSDGDNAVYSKVFHPEVEGRFLLGIEGQILETADMGDSWSTAYENDLYPYILTMAQPNGELSETIYASGTENGAQGGNLYFLLSEDFGENWEKFSSEQQFQNMSVNDLFVREIGVETTVFLASSNGAWIFRD